MAQELITKIETELDVRKWLKELIKVHKVFPDLDGDFADYVNNETGKPTFSKKEITRLNKLMDKAHAVCSQKSEGRIYDIGLQIVKPLFKVKKK